MKNIIFSPFKDDTKTNYLKPVPASTALPFWYKKMPLRRNGESKLKILNPNIGSTNATVKMCAPFLDAMLTGYMVYLSADVVVEKSEASPGVSQLYWRAGGPDFITTHDKWQIEGIPISYRFTSQPYKWHNDWSIQTPPGYSCFFTHPINRFDLPFQTLSGVVDTDSYTVPVLFPFLLDKNFEGVIEKGTPIAQVFPFKRESWKCKESDFDHFKMTSEFNKIKSIIELAYKRLHWSKKSYK